MSWGCGVMEPRSTTVGNQFRSAQLVSIYFEYLVSNVTIARAPHIKYRAAVFGTCIILYRISS